MPTRHRFYFIFRPTSICLFSTPFWDSGFALLDCPVGCFGQECIKGNWFGELDFAAMDLISKCIKIFTCFVINYIGWILGQNLICCFRYKIQLVNTANLLNFLLQIIKTTFTLDATWPYMYNQRHLPNSFELAKKIKSNHIHCVVHMNFMPDRFKFFVKKSPVKWKLEIPHR